MDARIWARGGATLTSVQQDNSFWIMLDQFQPHVVVFSLEGNWLSGINNLPHIAAARLFLWGQQLIAQFGLWQVVVCHQWERARGYGSLSQDQYNGKVRDFNTHCRALEQSGNYQTAFHVFGGLVDMRGKLSSDHVHLNPVGRGKQYDGARSLLIQLSTAWRRH